uniref:Uncharacterized protein n=1 Tax=Anopheles arabiensis TaxID=7173 RepID=A0A182HYD1_ANOAR
MTPKRWPLSSLDAADGGKTSDSSNLVHRGSCPNLNLDAASDDEAHQLAVLKRRQEVEKRRMELELQLKFVLEEEALLGRCGYTNWENMLRLQKCLKGSTLEAVRSRLVLPDVVSQVIEKLRSKYGRPVPLIKTLIEKVRQIPAPQTDKLDNLVE